MEIRNCKECGRLFNYLSGRPVCQACKDKLETKFHEVKEYIRSNPGASIQQVSDEMDVSTRQITQWVREERLCFSEDSPFSLDCESCGVAIKTGRFCPACVSKLQNNLQGAISKPKVTMAPKKASKDGERMRFLDNM